MKVLKTALSSVITLALIINLAGCSDSNVSPSLPESSNETTVSSTASETTSSTEENTAPQTEGTTASTASSELTPPTEESKAPETEATTVSTTTSKVTSTREESKTPESSKTTTVTTTSKTTTTKEQNKTPVSSTKTTKDDNKAPEKEEDEDVGFITVDGKLLRDENNKEYIIKGIAFGNNVWANPETPPENRHHTEESYKELAELDFNSVRFYLNYGLFESDDNPYVYNEAGFEWLDKNIAQAKKYGIKLLLNMHYPQGGYQSQGAGNALWLYKENQNRLTALWTEIARRYSDEPTILGYGIVNEPVVAIQTDNPADALKLWQKVAQQITNGIRTVDNNHLIFVEKMCAVSYANTGKVEWGNFNDENNYVRINDANVVY
ncbi:MAG: cellulase family glycosylhydrolase [Ruminiclostridium sp.]|nr:cellulase family glycosylhydrolase [Ruminiclostridium sp.]